MLGIVFVFVFITGCVLMHRRFILCLKLPQAWRVTWQSLLKGAVEVPFLLLVPGVALVGSFLSAGILVFVCPVSMLYPSQCPFSVVWSVFQYAPVHFRQVVYVAYPCVLVSPVLVGGKSSLYSLALLVVSWTRHHVPTLVSSWSHTGWSLSFPCSIPCPFRCGGRPFAQFLGLVAVVLGFPSPIRGVLMVVGLATLVTAW